MSQTPKRLATRLTAVGERHLRLGHPWIYDQSIERIKGEGEPGDLAVIFDRRKDHFLGIGLYDPHSPIRIKVLHQGQPVRIDEAFFNDKIDQAFGLRRPLMATDTNSYRLINGENDGFPGLILDVYAQAAVIKLYSLIWRPYFAAIVEKILGVTGANILILRLSRLVSTSKDLPVEWKDGIVLINLTGAPVNSTISFREHGLHLSANVLHGHKTGFFLDHRHNRKRVGELARDRNVLDIFSYAGGFTVHALNGGATEVTSLDISSQALEMAKQNIKLNFSNKPHKIIVGDAFETMEQLHKNGCRYDLIVVDPPSFAKRESEKEGALKAYRRLTKLALQIIAPRGILLLASCSARVSTEEFFQLQREELASSGRSYREMETTQHDIDHPVTFPEGSYLKSIYFELL